MSESKPYIKWPGSFQNCRKSINSNGDENLDGKVCHRVKETFVALKMTKKKIQFVGDSY